MYFTSRYPFYFSNLLDKFPNSSRRDQQFVSRHFYDGKQLEEWTNGPFKRGETMHDASELLKIHQTMLTALASATGLPDISPDQILTSRGVAAILPSLFRLSTAVHEENEGGGKIFKLLPLPSLSRTNYVLLFVPHPPLTSRFCFLQRP